MTPGNAFADFCARFHPAFGLNKEMVRNSAKKILTHPRQETGDRYPGEVMTIKGLIRRGDKAGCRYTGIPDPKAHFLDMPFAVGETGTVKKKPLVKKTFRSSLT